MTARESTREVALGPSASIGKRLIDIFGSALLLILTAPFLTLAAVAIRATMGSPILFRQERGGYQGAVFLLFKLRTMTDKRDKHGEVLPPWDRTPGLGKLLRRFSIDELPQLWNVLRGDMSLIGPRPLLASYLPAYNEHQRRRHLARPGLSGWAQVMGRNSLTWEEKFSLDVWYVENWSLRLDVLICLRTLLFLFSGRGVSDQGTPSEVEFARSSGRSSGQAGAG